MSHNALKACLAAVLFPLLMGIARSQVVQAAEIEKAEFLMSIDVGDGNSKYFKTNTVPYIPEKACYGWRIKLASGDSLVKFKEILSLPKAPEFWDGEKDTYSTHAISKNRTTSVTEEYVPVTNGWIGNSWCVAEGDPLGDYSMDIYIEGRFVETFKFRVVSTK